MSDWSIEDSRKLYNIDGLFKSRYYSIDEQGYLLLRIGDRWIRLYDLVHGYNLESAYIRVLPWIKELMDEVCSIFNQYIKKYGYSGGFIPVYPLKANSNPLIVDTIYEYGSRYKWGFNVNTLGEIETIYKYIDRDPRFIVVDGVKNNSIISKLNEFKEKKWFIIVNIESPRDVKLLENTDFNLGIRVKCLLKGESKWVSTGIDSKFGLNLKQVIQLIENHPWITRRVVMLHVHPGSQIHRFSFMEKFIVESVNLYNILKDHGFKELKYIDFGGGLPYPYLETRVVNEYSPDYGLNEYAELVVKTLKNEAVDNPSIVFESGRYIVAIHRINVFKIIDHTPYDSYIGENVEEHGELSENLSLDSLRLQNDILRYSIVNPRYKLSERLKYEEDVYRFNEFVKQVFHESIFKRGESTVLKYIDFLREHLFKPTFRYITSFSVFAHIPDYLIVNQYFQVVPIQRLNEKPDVYVVLSDVTCDSMGEYGLFLLPGSKFNEFKTTCVDGKPLVIPGHDIMVNAIPLHVIRENEDYYIAFLDTGAYQDNLSMRHNTYGEIDELIIDLGENGIVLKHVKPGG